MKETINVDDFLSGSRFIRVRSLSNTSYAYFKPPRTANRSLAIITRPVHEPELATLFIDCLGCCNLFQFFVNERHGDFHLRTVAARRISHGKELARGVVFLQCLLEKVRLAAVHLPRVKATWPNLAWALPSTNWVLFISRLSSAR